jgi:hypothetical protein
MEIILKATIINDTSSSFNNAKISLIETSQMINNPMSSLHKENVRYATRAIPNQQYEGQIYLKQLSTSSEDTSQEQKTYDIKALINLEKKSHKDVIMSDMKGIPGQLQYIYTPQTNNEVIYMNLFWERESHKQSQMSLPVGGATVLKKDYDRLVKLGKSTITKELSSKANIRLALGPANMLVGKFEYLGKTKDNLAGTYTQQYKITITNKTNMDKTILMKFTFEKSDYKSEGLDFDIWEPDNKDEPRYAKLGKSIIDIGEKQKKEIKFSLTYNM